MWISSGRGTNSKPTGLEQQVKFRDDTWQYEIHEIKKCSSLGDVHIYDSGNQSNGVYFFFFFKQLSYQRVWKSLTPWSMRSRLWERQQCGDAPQRAPRQPLAVTPCSWSLQVRPVGVHGNSTCKGWVDPVCQITHDSTCQWLTEQRKAGANLPKQMLKIFQ